MRKIFLYIVLVLAITFILHASYFPAFEKAHSAFACAEEDNAPPTSVLEYLCGIIVVILNFPMLYFWSFVGGDWLKQYWGDNAVMSLFVAIDAILWSIVTISVAFTIQRLRKKYKKRKNNE